MTSDQQTNNLQARVTVAKDITATARDAGLLLLGLLLIVFPSTFNTILVSAGFEEAPAVRKVVARAFDHAGAYGDDQCGVTARLSKLISGSG
jgi:hypothetical protein